MPRKTDMGAAVNPQRPSSKPQTVDDLLEDLPPIPPRDLKHIEYLCRPGSPMPQAREALVALVGELRQANRRLIGEVKLWKKQAETFRLHKEVAETMKT